MIASYYKINANSDEDVYETMKKILSENFEILGYLHIYNEEHYEDEFKGMDIVNYTPHSEGSKTFLVSVKIF